MFPTFEKFSLYLSVSLLVGITTYLDDIISLVLLSNPSFQVFDGGNDEMSENSTFLLLESI